MPQIAPPHGQAYFGTRRAMHKGQDGATGFRAASGRLKRKSAVRQNGAIKTGADNGAHGRASRAPTPQAKAFGRIPKNRPLGGFLDGIPPHRFEPHSVPPSDQSYRLDSEEPHSQQRKRAPCWVSRLPRKRSEAYFGTRATIEGQDAAQHGAQRRVVS